MSEKPTIAVLGAGGTMGLPMARNLLKAGFPVRAWNRSPEKAKPLSEDGAEVFESAAEAAKGAEVVLTMVADADAVLSIMEDVLENGSFDAIWLQMSTIGEQGTEHCIKLAQEHSIELVDAPVLGTKQPAEQGKLVILGSGPEELRDRLAEAFDAVGGRIMWVGEAGAGTKLKVAINTWIVTVVEGAAETLALAEGLGLDPSLVLEAVGGGALDLPYLQMKGKAMIEGDFEPSFRLALAAKDAGLAETAAQDHDLELPLISAIRQRLDQAAQEHGDKDMCATYLLSAQS